MGYRLNWLQSKLIRRIKNLVGYPSSTTEKMIADKSTLVLTELEHYGLGSVRSWDGYMELTGITIDEENDAFVCHKMEWCNYGLKE